MKTYVKCILSALGGLVVGAGAGCAGTYFFMKAKCEEYVAVGIADGVNAYIEEIENGLEEDGMWAGDDDEPMVNPPSKVTEIRRTRDTNKDTDYTAFSKDEHFSKKTPQEILAESEHPVDSDEEVEDPEEGLEDEDTGDDLTFEDEEEEAAYLEGKTRSAERRSNVLSGKKPHIIKEDVFNNDGKYEKAELFYYLEDDIISDDDGNMIEITGPMEAVAELLDNCGWIDKCNKFPKNPPRIWVRSDVYEMDYAITAIDEAYFSDGR